MAQRVGITIDEAKAKTDQTFVDATNDLLLDMATAIIERTPVDTGRARLGWEIELLEKIGDTGTITNDVPYITRLEYGWSKQAPHGMVRITMAENQRRADLIAARYV